MYINIHTHHITNNTDTTELIDYSNNHSISDNKPRYCSIGVHPWHIKGEFSINTLEKHARNLGVLAIGECGIDKLKGPSLDIQNDIFASQIKLSEKLRLPIIIHCVRAYSEIIKFRKELHPTQPWIFHGFNASKETMEQALRQGFYFSMGEAILKSNSKASQSLPFIPHNRLFLETDDNPQLSIESIYKKASYLLNLELAQLQAIILDNFKQLFNVDTQFNQSIK